MLLLMVLLLFLRFIYDIIYLEVLCLPRRHEVIVCRLILYSTRRLYPRVRLDHSLVGSYLSIESSQLVPRPRHQVDDAKVSFTFKLLFLVVQSQPFYLNLIWLLCLIPRLRLYWRASLALDRRCLQLFFFRSLLSLSGVDLGVITLAVIVFLVIVIGYILRNFLFRGL